jgi:MFS family permease
VPFLLLLSAVVLSWFVRIERERQRDGRPVLLSLEILRPPAMRAGLSTLALQQLTLLGMFFLLPVYLQTVLGLDAFESGVRIVPLSIALLVTSLLGPRMAARRSPRTVVRVGLVALVVGSIATAGTVNLEATGVDFALSLSLFGAGAGLLLSQLGNVIMSSAPAERSSEGGGLQGTAQNLGASLGTALIGSVLLLGLTSGVTERIEDNDAVPADVRERVLAAAETGLDVVPVDAVEDAAIEAGLPAEEAEQLATGYAEEELFALRRALLVVALLTTIGWWTSRQLPTGARE